MFERHFAWFVVNCNKMLVSIKSGIPPTSFMVNGHYDDPWHIHPAAEASIRVFSHRPKVNRNPEMKVLRNNNKGGYLMWPKNQGVFYLLEHWIKRTECRASRVLWLSLSLVWLPSSVLLQGESRWLTLWWRNINKSSPKATAMTTTIFFIFQRHFHSSFLFARFRLVWLDLNIKLCY